MFFIPLLHLHLLIYSIYFSIHKYIDLLATLHRPHIDPTSTLHRPHIDPTSTLHRPYIDPTSTLHRPYIDPIKTIEMRRRWRRRENNKIVEKEEGNKNEKGEG